MKRLLLTVTVVIAAIVLLGPGISSAVPPVSGTVSDYPAGVVANGIVISRHNLGVFGRVLATGATSQVCIFCHTPHHATTGTSPLWNRSLANSVNYIGYGTTIAGTTVNQADLGGSTLACLSCHDGATTFDSLVNAPGKGGVVAGGTDLNWGFNMPGLPLGPTGLTSLDHFGNKTTPNVLCLACHSPGAFATPDTPTSLSLDFDLTNDHPVSVPYSASSKASLRPQSTLISAINLSAGLNVGAGGETSPFLTNNLSQNRWAVSGFISTTATIANLLRNGQVECSSCHDPHFRNLSYDEVDSTYLYATKRTVGIPQSWCSGEDCVDGFFLRRVGGNTGSGVCRTCHDK